MKKSINKSQEENRTAFPVLQPPPTRSLTIPAYWFGGILP